MWVETTESFIRMFAIVLSMVAPATSAAVRLALGEVLIYEGGLIHITFIWSFFTLFPIALTLPFYYFAIWVRQKIYSRRISDAQHSEAIKLLDECASQLNIVPPPKLIVLRSTSIDCGLEKIDRDHIHLVVGEDVLTHLNKNELKAAFIHELSHIKNGDAKFMIWSKLLAFNIRNGIFTMILGLMILTPFIGPPSSPTDAMLLYQLFLFFGLAYLSIKSISRVRELLADATACMELGSDLSLVSAIRRLAWLEIQLKILSTIFSPTSISKKFSFLPKPVVRLAGVLKKYTLDDHPHLSARLIALKRKRYIASEKDPRLLSLESSAYVGLVAFFLIVVLTMSMPPTLESVPIPVIAVYPILQLTIFDFFPIVFIAFLHSYYLTKCNWIFLSRRIRDTLAILSRINLRVLFSSLCVTLAVFLATLNLEGILAMFWTYSFASCLVTTSFLIFWILISRLIAWSGRTYLHFR